MVATAAEDRIWKSADGSILEVRIYGRLTKADYDAIVPAIDEEVKRHGQIRLLLDLIGFEGMTIGALVEDTKFALTHYRSIMRLAIVGDKRWERVMATLCRPFTKAEVQYYEISELEVARAWLREGL